MNESAASGIINTTSSTNNPFFPGARSDHARLSHGPGYLPTTGLGRRNVISDTQVFLSADYGR